MRKHGCMDILVLAGGLSPERDVSFSSGTMICNTLLSMGHRAKLIDLYFGAPAWDCESDFFADAAPLSPYVVPASAPDLDALRAARKGGFNDFIGYNVMALGKVADVVFMALHGDCGENGKLQSIFDHFGIRYTGSGSHGCAVAMDKWASKQVFRSHDILTPTGVTLQQGKPFDPRTLPLPCVVKPCCGGSSIGVSIVTERHALPAAIETAFAVEPVILVEEYVKGREISCGILGEDALPLIEIVPNDGFYDYKNKYQAGGAKEITPADVAPDIAQKISEAAKAVFRTLHLSVYARIDFLLTARGDAYCLEANTLPGMTPTSLLPQEAAAADLDYASLCARILDLSLKK